VVIWRRPLGSQGLGGIAATRERVIVSDRDLADAADVFRCLDAQTGNELWAFRYPAAGKLDYGNSPRATPLIHGDRVFFFGAFGHLSCVDLKTGKPAWQLDTRDEFEITRKMPWGMCGSPLVAANRLILNPGGKRGSLAALDVASGEIVWRSAGRPASYGSYIAAELGGRLQVIGHDATTLGGWDAASGQRLWTITPESSNDFNVPTPIVHRGRLLVSTENNGTRMYRFSGDGKIEPQPAAVFRDLAPDTHSPVVVGERLFGISQELFCLDLKDDLKVVWQGTDDAFYAHTSLIASDDRLLVFGSTGELLLLDPHAADFKLLGRLALVPDGRDLLSHPALVGDRLYVRSHNEIVCVSLAP
ncbi:MAG: PQQ-binding-like beta-propeller repeat protein, partial [Planctomycetia bacterium]|nr:PQQ-binding-like beta-propeller repeat protein [Planctomycetia bacterium]